ncbi:claudin-9-like [Corythoichthys intestinalis]|uniref:claudin-9-like n=1 Tax=Corythoichthys intestinalis TaxID=161448 RepID=UPI0025A541F8|nr:claudin-9-like [Corythoichthys intestinalis]
MASAGVELLGLTLAVAGWIGVMVACGLPMWRVAAYVGQNVVMSQVIWEGLWMNCSVQSTGQMHCKVHDSMLGLPRDLQAARALVVVSVTLGVIGVALATAGAKCTDCSQDEKGKRRLVFVGGLVLTLAGILTLMAVSWTAHVIVMGFYDPLLEETGKRDFGNALYFGWAASCLLILGGALLWCTCGKRKTPQVRKVSEYSAVSRRGRGKQDYV